MNLESAAFIISMLVRQRLLEVDNTSFWRDTELFLQYRFLVCFTGSWSVARELLDNPLFPFGSYESGTILNCHFAFHWLSPSKELKPDFGFFMEREYGNLIKPGGGPEALIREGRVLIRFPSNTGTPHASRAVLLGDCPNTHRGPFLSVHINWVKIRSASRNGICILQLALHSLLMDTWYRYWTLLLDEVDGCVHVRVSEYPSR